MHECFIIVTKLGRLRGSLSAAHLGNSMSSGNFNSAYCGSLDVELRTCLVLASGWFKPVCWLEKSENPVDE